MCQRRCCSSAWLDLHVWLLQTLSLGVLFSSSHPLVSYAIGLSGCHASLSLHPAQAVQTSSFTFTANCVLDSSWQGDQSLRTSPESVCRGCAWALGSTWARTRARRHCLCHIQTDDFINQEPGLPCALQPLPCYGCMLCLTWQGRRRLCCPSLQDLPPPSQHC